MNFTLNNFKSHVDSTILQRGREYYQSGQVIDLEEVGDGMWSAVVSGSDNYDVLIEQFDGNNLLCDCNCPYEYGPTCKHVASVLYAIEETFTEYMTKKASSKPRKKRKTKQEKVVDALNNLDKEELVNFIAGMAKSDRTLSDKILAQYGNDGFDKQAYKKLIQGILTSETDGGFIDYHGSIRAGRQIYQTVSHAQQETAANRLWNAVILYQAVIESVSPVIPHADDSNGDLGDCLVVSLENLKNISSTLTIAEQETLFDYCLSEAVKEVYEGWDWGWDLARIAAGIIKNEIQRHRLYDVLDTMASHSTKDKRISGMLSNFDYERAELIKLTVIERLDDSKSAEKFLIEHLELERFRERLVHFYIEIGRFAEARQLCNEWLIIPHQRKRGFYRTFTELLLQIASKEEKPDEVIKLAESLFLDTGDFAYYDRLKEQIADENWQDFVKQLIPKAEKAPLYRLPTTEIYVREEMWDKLLAAMDHTNRRLVDYYRKYLEPRFPEAMCDIYEKIARDILASRANRKGYREVCHYLHQIQQLGQEDRVEALIQEFRDTYSKRRALLEELDKL